MVEAQPTDGAQVTTNTQSGSSWPPLPEPGLRGDALGADIRAYLDRRMNENQFDAFCIDCQNNRSTHCNVTFGTFICADCAQIHAHNFPMHESYIKAIFDECWDTFQITSVQVGGNQRFYEFAQQYGNERNPIAKKYSQTSAKYYRRRLASQARNLPFTEQPPAKNISEAATRTADNTSAWFKTNDEKYQVSQKASQAGAAVAAGASSLWGRMKTMVNKKPDGNTDAAASSNAGADAAQQ